MSSYEILSQYTSGKKELDHDFFEAKEILAERLSILQSQNPAFGNVSFSQDVEKLSEQTATVFA